MHSVLRGVYSAPSRTEGRRREEQIQLHPSPAALPEAHVIFRWNTVGLRTKEARVHRHPSCLRLHAHLPSSWFFLFFWQVAGASRTLIWSEKQQICQGWFIFLKMLRIVVVTPPRSWRGWKKALTTTQQAWISLQVCALALVNHLLCFDVCVY